MSNIINKTIDLTSTTYNNIYHYILDIFIVNAEGIFTFISNKNIVTTGIGIIIGTNIAGLATVFTDVIVSPIVNGFSGGYIKDLQSLSFTILGIEFKIGLLLKKIIDFFSIVIIVYYIWKLTQITNVDSIIDKLKSMK